MIYFCFLRFPKVWTLKDLVFVLFQQKKLPSVNMPTNSFHHQYCFYLVLDLSMYLKKQTMERIMIELVKTWTVLTNLSALSSKSFLNVENELSTNVWFHWAFNIFSGRSTKFQLIWTTWTCIYLRIPICSMFSSFSILELNIS